MSLESMTGFCDTCDHCRVRGYDPRKEIMTISYWCEAKQRHVTPCEECKQWVEGGPCLRAREAFGR